MKLSDLNEALKLSHELANARKVLHALKSNPTSIAISVQCQDSRNSGAMVDKLVSYKCVDEIGARVEYQIQVLEFKLRELGVDSQ